MKNKEIADQLYEIADFLEIQEVEYKPRAYRRAARSVESLSEDVEDIYERGELQEIDDVGESIAEKIAEYLETGELEYYEQLKADLPVDIDALTSVEGIGPQTAKTLYEKLGVTDLDDLERAAREGAIAEIEGFGEKTQQNILDHIGMAKAGQERMLLGRAFPIADELQERLDQADEFERVDIAGSFRRRRPTVGDLDVLATADDPEAAMEVFCTHEDVKDVLSRGPTKSSVIVSGDLQIDLRLVDPGEYGAALVYFTGSKDHNIALRNLAIDRDWKLNEYRLFDVSDVEASESGLRKGERIAGGTEDDVYDALDLAWIPPELREDTGEIDVAANDDLPELVELSDIQGDLQLHTDYSDGSNTVQEMVNAADERGLDYVLISDHGPSFQFASGINQDEFEDQRDDIERLRADDDVEVETLHGIEAEITTDGLDVSEEWCDRCDVVVGAMHSNPSNPTEVVQQAFVEHPIDIFAHPSNRLIHEREPLDLDVEAVVETAAEEGIALEINAQPERLDLDWQNVKEYRDDATYVVSTDAHTTSELDFMHLGVAQARRGWCTTDDVLNTKPLDEIRSLFEG
ncbi:DNA polymerase/3'-5' exonuclease PolX [Halorussus salinisoli]|uniref:DNA polymerase/3'-5' exonuclease PolX n=1 Tax=Halorussus salinisoli TaxID=2558242 RepID=UPI002A918B24|nr:DNA polymerase/3'-5' exonuclease PolX [Halorussus salinisoli]